MSDETPPTVDPPRPKNVDEAVALAVARANDIQKAMMGANVPADDISVMALAIVAALAAKNMGMSMADAFALYLAAYEQIHDVEQDRLAALMKHLRNTFGDVISRVTGLPDPKKETTH